MFKKKMLMVLINMLMIFILIGGKSVCATNNTAIETSKDQKIILIDPGHGGMDGGAVSKRGTMEKNINLIIGLRLKENLEKQGYKVVMTRESDAGLYEDQSSVKEKKNTDLSNRCKLKKSSNCDMFISIHLNMFPQSQYYGAQVWYSDNMGSKRFARIIQQNLVDNLDKNNKRKEKAAKNDYKVLRCVNNIPAVIVECGFLSNNVEEEKLKTEDYQQKIADSLSQSVKEYFCNTIDE